MPRHDITDCCRINLTDPKALLIKGWTAVFEDMSLGDALIAAAPLAQFLL